MFNSITSNSVELSTKSKGLISAVAATAAVFSLLFFLIS